jgi:hypothetical protein
MYAVVVPLKARHRTALTAVAVCLWGETGREKTGEREGERSSVRFGTTSSIQSMDRPVITRSSAPR